VKRESHKLREETFFCIFNGRASHLDEFCFRHKGFERRRFEYARKLYRDKFFDFLPHFYSCGPPRTSSRTLSQFSHGPNHRSYGFGSRENRFVPRRLGYDSHPYRRDRFPCRPGFSTGGSYTHVEPIHLDGPCFPRRDSRLTQPSGEVQRIVKTSSGHMVWCSIPKIYLTNPSTEPSTFSRPM
jgi:hypothetical protein